MKNRGNLKILVAEDHPGVAQLLADTLEVAGFSSTEFKFRADAAVSYLEKEERPDIVITDLRMPGGSGLDVLRAAKSLSPPIPCIVASATWKADDKSEIRAHGAEVGPFQAIQREDSDCLPGQIDGRK